MNKIKIILETDGKKIGYIIDAEKQHCTSGTFDINGEAINEVSQSGSIDNPTELCQQISWILMACLKNKNGQS